MDNVKPEVITDMSMVNLDVTKMTYRLVQMEGVHFENGGKNTFAKVETKEYGEENLKDAHGNVIMVRTSSYASFASETLPVGTGTVVGILGRFKGTWQLMIPAVRMFSASMELNREKEMVEMKAVKRYCLAKRLKRLKKPVKVTIKNGCQ